MCVECVGPCSHGSADVYSSSKDTILFKVAERRDEEETGAKEVGGEVYE